MRFQTFEKRRNMTKRIWAVALSLVVALAACEGTPTETLNPSETAGLSQSGGWTKVQGSMPAFSVSGVIGAEGGTIGIPGYTLTVPRNAVLEPAVFTFESVDNGYMQIRATATSVGSARVNDVGSAGFRTPVQIRLTYHPAGGVPAWQRLRMGWVRPDGEIVAIPTRLNVARWTVTGHASHFSEYALIWP
jgi:hypothetical protein